MGKLSWLLLLIFMMSSLIAVGDDGLSDDDNPPGLKEYLKQLDAQKKNQKQGFHIYSEEGNKALQSDMGEEFVPIVKKEKKKLTRQDKLKRRNAIRVKQAAAQKFRMSREEMMNKLFKEKFERESFMERANRRHDIVQNQSGLFLEGVNNQDVGRRGPGSRGSSDAQTVADIENYHPGAPAATRRAFQEQRRRQIRQEQLKRFQRNIAAEKSGKEVSGTPVDANVPALRTKLQKFKPKERMHRTPVDFVEGLEFPTGTDPFLALVDEKNALRDDELTRSRVKLGQSLFHDKNLSKDRNVSCASCHNPDLHFMDGQRFPVGVERRMAGNLNTPSINNVIFRKKLFWDGRADGLEKMSLMPFMNPREMGMKDKEEIVERVKQDRRRYGQLFQDAYEGEISAHTIGRAIASFQRTLIIGNSKVDHFLAGDFHALNTEEKRGFEIFTSKGKCVACHRLEHDFAGPVDSDHRVSTGLFRDVPDSKKFVIPTLRNISKTAPYFHDGRVSTLKEVIEIYDRGAVHKSDKVSEMTREPLNLTFKEKQKLLKFLKALDSYPLKQKIN